MLPFARVTYDTVELRSRLCKPCEINATVTGPRPSVPTKLNSRRKWQNIFGGVRFVQCLCGSEAYLHGPRTISDCDLFGCGYAGSGSAHGAARHQSGRKNRPVAKMRRTGLDVEAGFSTERFPPQIPKTFRHPAFRSALRLRSAPVKIRDQEAGVSVAASVR